MEEAIQTTENSASEATTSAETVANEPSVPQDSPESNTAPGLAETGSTGLAEDSGEPATKKAEAAFDAAWINDARGFENRMNGLLAAKENLRLVAAHEKLHSAYSLSWKNQSNRYFQLVVMLRRRINQGKVGGKLVS